jgi:hypothetical protein
MNIKTCRYVEASEIFKGFGLAMDVFINSDPDCSWGDNNRSMVTADVIINALEESDLNVGNEAKQVEQVIKILDSLEPDVYIDLEN